MAADMQEFLVIWKTQVNGINPVDAAQCALDIQRGLCTDTNVTWEISNGGLHAFDMINECTMPDAGYMVSWIIQIDGTDVADALRKVVDIQRDPWSLATAFVVVDTAGIITDIDLAKLRNILDGKGDL